MRKKVYAKKIVKSTNKKVKNATKLELPDGTKFRSKLELFTYNKLIENGIHNFKYEQDKFILMDNFVFNTDSVEAFERKIGDKKSKFFDVIDGDIRAITYLPDFTCINPDKTGWILECKGYANDAFPLKWKLFKRHLVNNGYKVTLYKPNNQGNVLKCIELIKNKYYE